MQRVEGSRVGREELGWAAVLVLIVAGAAFLSIPRSSISSTISTSVSANAGDASPGTLNALQTYHELNRFTTTNNQVQGVDELDKVKTDGSYLYVATSQTVSIIKAQAGSATVVSTIKLPLANIMGIATVPQRLAVISQGSAGASISLRLYDVSDPNAPSLLNSVGVNGSHVAARVSQGY